MFTRRHLTQPGWLLYGAGVITSLVYSGLILFAEPSPEAETIFYPPVILRYWELKAVAVVVLLLVGGAGSFYARRRNLDVAIGLILPFLIVLVIALYVTQPMIGDSRINHIETLSANGHIYNLTSSHSLKLMLYECDGLGVICHRIYEGSALVSLTPPDG